MGSKFVLVFVYLLALTSCTREIPLDHTMIPEISSTEGAYSEDDTNQDIPTLENAFGGFFTNSNSMGRWNHSRMVKASTTLGYDDWWFLTTSRRPVISYKDFPGRPGVATWKEISANTADNRKSRKMTTPTAAEVSNSSGRYLTYLNPAFLISLVGTMFILNSYRWT